MGWKKSMKRHLKVLEQTGLKPVFDTMTIEALLEPWERPVTRSAVARVCKSLFPESFIYIGGHHVAIHNPLTGDRMLMIGGDTPDFC